MDAKSMRNLGIVGSVIGAIIFIWGFVKHSNAKSMYKASSWFGETDSSQIWSGYMQNYKTWIIVGAIIFVVFVILAIAGVINSMGNVANSDTLSKTQSNVPVSEKVKELKIMLENNLITQEEFDAKKKEIMDKM
ncbi:MAG: SHOCT domain-containing protein [Lachnospiraceae bacterium]|nr:SHOCT domain-containing protein [Lachnospiraceae bacterium]